MAEETEKTGIERRSAFKLTMAGLFMPKAIAAKAATEIIPAIETTAGHSLLTPAMRATGAAMYRVLDAKEKVESLYPQAAEWRNWHDTMWMGKRLKSWLSDDGHKKIFGDLESNPDERARELSKYARLPQLVQELYNQHHHEFMSFYTSLCHFYAQQEGRRELREDINTINALPSLETETVKQLEGATNPTIRAVQEQYLQTLRQEKNRLMRKYGSKSAEELTRFANDYSKSSGDFESNDIAERDRAVKSLYKHIYNCLKVIMRPNYSSYYIGTNPEWIKEAAHQLTDAIVLDAGGDLPGVHEIYSVDTFGKPEYIFWHRDNWWGDDPVPNLLPQHSAQTARYLERINTIPFVQLVTDSVMGMQEQMSHKERFDATNELNQFFKLLPNFVKSGSPYLQCIPHIRGLQDSEIAMYALASAKRLGIALPDSYVRAAKKEINKIHLGPMDGDEQSHASALQRRREVTKRIEKEAGRFYKDFNPDKLIDAVDTVGKYAIRAFMANILAEHSTDPRASYFEAATNEPIELTTISTGSEVRLVVYEESIPGIELPVRGSDELVKVEPNTVQPG